jgi:hypothetical protein
VGERIIGAVLDEARAQGIRLMISELPDDPVMGRMRALLGSNGFKEEARVPDYFRDGIALTLFRRAL